MRVGVFAGGTLKRVMGSCRGVALVEAAIVVPLLIILIFGAIDIFRVLTTRFAVQAALSEGIRLAQATSALHENVWDLTGSPADTSKLQNFVRARERVIQSTQKMIRTQALSGLKLKDVTHYDSISGGTPALASPTALAYLPPAYSAYVGDWGKEVTNDFYCSQGAGFTFTLPGSKDQRAVAGCQRPGNLLSLAAEYPTELKAFTEVPTFLLGKFKLTVTASGYVPVSPVGVSTTSSKMDTDVAALPFERSGLYSYIVNMDGYSVAIGEMGGTNEINDRYTTSGYLYYDVKFSFDKATKKLSAVISTNITNAAPLLVPQGAQSVTLTEGQPFSVYHAGNSLGASGKFTYQDGKLKVEHYAPFTSVAHVGTERFVFVTKWK